MAASNTDRFKKLTNNFSTTLSGAIVGAGDSSMSLSSTTNLPTDTGAVFVIDRVNSSGTATPTLREYVVGTVSGSNVTNLVRGVGNSTAQAHSIGAVVEQVVDQRTINDIVDGLLVQHNQDGTHGAITATSVASSGAVSGTTGTFSSDVSDNSTTLKTIRSEVQFDYVASGCVWSGDSYGSTKAASMTSGVVYIGGKRVAVSAVTSRTFTASKDTYVDVDNTGTITYTEVTNNAASPALAANSLRIAIIVTGASNIANSGSVNQGQQDRVLPIASSIAYSVTDSLGNLICPRDPQRKIIGYREILSTFNVVNTTTPTYATGLAVPVIVPTGRSIRVSLVTQALTDGNTANTSPFMAIYEAASAGTLTTRKAMAGTGQLGAAAAARFPALAQRIYTPSSTSIFLNAAVWNSSATSWAAITATSDSPAYLIVELV